MNICIVGTDEIGLSTAILLAYLDNFVILVDDNQTKIDLLKNNSLHFYEPQLNDALRLVNNSLYFTTNLTQAVETADVVYFTSGTGGNGGYSAREVCQIFQQSLKTKHRLLVNKSIGPLGRTKEMERIVREKSNNFSIAFEAPYITSGNIIVDTFFPEKIVIGVNDMLSSDNLNSLYSPLFEKKILLPDFIRPPHRQSAQIIWTDINSAELAFHSENVFNGLKTSFLNEINNIAQQYGAKTEDVLRVLRATGINNLNLKYGLGWSKKGCGENFAILTDAAEKSKIDVPLIKSTLVSNYHQRDLIINKMSHILNGLAGKKIGILGLSYKPFSDDITDSPAIDIMQLLKEHKAVVSAHDPVVNFKMRFKFPELAVYYDNVSDVFQDADMVILTTEWPEYFEIDWFRYSKIMKYRFIFDARNVLPKEEFTSMGFELLSFGAGG